MAPFRRYVVLLVGHYQRHRPASWQKLKRSAPAILQDIEDIERAKMNGQPALKVSRATGNAWSGHIGKPSEEIIRKLNEEVFKGMSETWDADLGCKLRAVPIKADALWVAKVEKDTLLSLKVLIAPARAPAFRRFLVWGGGLVYSLRDYCHIEDCQKGPHLLLTSMLLLRTWITDCGPLKGRKTASGSGRLNELSWKR